MSAEYGCGGAGHFPIPNMLHDESHPEPFYTVRLASGECQGAPGMGKAPGIPPRSASSPCLLKGLTECSQAFRVWPRWSVRRTMPVPGIPSAG